MRRLTTRQLEDVARVQRVILSSDAYSDPQEWMRDVNAEVKSLLRSELAAFMISTPTSSLAETDLSPEVWERYFEEVAELDVAIPMLEELAAPFATQEDVLRTQLHTSYFTGPAYNDWYVPHSMDRAISLRAYGHATGSPDFGPKWSSTLVGNILLGSSSMATGEETPVARTMLTLIHPPFEAAVRSVQQRLTLGSLNFAERLSPALESLDRPIWFFDGDGQCIHQSVAASQLIGRLSEGDVLQAATKQLARALILASRTNVPISPTWTVEVSGERLHLSAGLLRETGPRSPTIMVRADGVLPLLPTEATLQAARGCTPQEARIAIMLALGASPAMIASRLAISIHTVRRHTEGILTKLQIKRTAEVGPKLLEIRAETASVH